MRTAKVLMIIGNLELSSVRERRSKSMSTWRMYLLDILEKMGPSCARMKHGVILSCFMLGKNWLTIAFDLASGMTRKSPPVCMRMSSFRACSSGARELWRGLEDSIGSERRRTDVIFFE